MVGSRLLRFCDSVARLDDLKTIKILFSYTKIENERCNELSTRVSLNFFYEINEKIRNFISNRRSQLNNCRYLKYSNYRAPSLKRHRQSI